MTGDISWNPAAVAQYAAEAGYVTENDGTAWALMSEGCSHFGLLAQDVALWEDTMIQALEDSPLICALGPGDFTQVGHYIVIIAYENGAFRVLDPNSKANSEKKLDIRNSGVPDQSHLGLHPGKLNQQNGRLSQSKS